MQVLLILLLAPCQDRPEPRASDRVQRLLQEALTQTLTKLKHEKWSLDDLSATLIDLQETPEMAGHRAETSYYPASVVKMCYMAATYEWTRLGRVKIDSAYERDLRDMMGPSSNTATQRIVDRLSGTVDGPALTAKEYAAFAEKRNAVNRWLGSLGLKETNACQKTFDGGEISPRDYQLLRGGKSSGAFTNRNRMTTKDTARLLLWIATDRIVGKEACAKMRELMKRDLKTYPEDKTLAVGGVPEGSKVWAKVGLTSSVWHEAALVELPKGHRFILVVFTNASSYEGPLIAELTAAISQKIER